MFYNRSAKFQMKSRNLSVFTFLVDTKVLKTIDQKSQVLKQSSDFGSNLTDLQLRINFILNWKKLSTFIWARCCQIFRPQVTDFRLQVVWKWARSTSTSRRPPAKFVWRRASATSRSSSSLGSVRRLAGTLSSCAWRTTTTRPSSIVLFGTSLFRVATQLELVKVGMP